MLNTEILADLKAFNWQVIVEYGNSLKDFNDAQWRFLKGLIVELTVEKHSNKNLKYVGEDHRDYVWPKHNIDVELKSQLSDNMYNKDGSLRKNYEVKLSNTNGTNKNKTLPESHVADCVIVVRNDGAFVLDKKTVLKHAKVQGDGVVVKVPKAAITEVSGRILCENTYNNNLKQLIMDAIRNDIPGL